MNAKLLSRLFGDLSKVQNDIVMAAHGFVGLDINGKTKFDDLQELNVFAVKLLMRGLKSIQIAIADETDGAVSLPVDVLSNYLQGENAYKKDEIPPYILNVINGAEDQELPTKETLVQAMIDWSQTKHNVEAVLVPGVKRGA